jgi:hypothetical protein
MCTQMNWSRSAIRTISSTFRAQPRAHIS